MLNNSSGQELGRSDPRDSPGIRLPPPLYYVAGLLAGITLDRLLPTVTIPPEIALWSGGLLVIAGAITALAAVYTFRRFRTSILPHRPASAFVRSGPYRFTRNPMYVAMTLVYLGLALLIRSTWSLPLLPFVMLAITRRVILREEGYLERRFGGEYSIYKGQVRRWL